jgi:predicted RNA-binding protein associated with RNAse of E/G family
VERRFEAGTPVALRDVWEGSVWAARAALVVEDTPDQVMLYIPVGTRWFAPVRKGRRLKIQQPDFELAELRNDDLHVLSFAWPDTLAAVLLEFRPDWSPLRWYVNLEEPLRRSAIGFDTLDHKLDVILELDGSWWWKDEDELAEAIRRGVIPAEREARLRTAAERAVQRIVERDPPFDRDWTTWRPDPAWPIPELPGGWERV